MRKPDGHQAAATGDLEIDGEASASRSHAHAGASSSHAHAGEECERVQDAAAAPSSPSGVHRQGNQVPIKPAAQNANEKDTQKAAGEAATQATLCL